MFIVYALYSEKYNKIYIGYTSDIEKRMTYHNELITQGWTRNFRPWRLIYTEQHTTKQEAMKREKQLKSYRGREFVRSLI